MDKFILKLSGIAIKLRNTVSNLNFVGHDFATFLVLKNNMCHDSATKFVISVYWQIERKLYYSLYGNLEFLRKKRFQIHVFKNMNLVADNNFKAKILGISFCEIYSKDEVIVTCN